MPKFQPTPEQIDMAYAHADFSQPRESCGVIADGAYVPMVNQAQEMDTFAMDMAAYRRLASTRNIEAIVHSHVNLPPLASEADRTACEATALPWVILSWPGKQFSVIEPNGFVAPLVGRQWAWGTLDCFALVRDAFRAYTGIVLPDFDRDWNFWQQGQDLIGAHYAEAGFVPLRAQEVEPQHCDVIGMRVNSPIINHLGIFIANPLSLTGGDLLHQLRGRLSVREVYGGVYLKATELHLRHKNFMEAPPA